MKKTTFFNISIVLLLLTSLCACNPEDPTEGDYDVTNLYGKWCQEGTKVYYKYNDDGTGATWDESDDVYEDEAQAFTWDVEGSEMIHIHLTETGTAQVPKYYIITWLSFDELDYYDAIVTTKRYKFYKVN
ncbi:MAG: hypothetical protein IK058_00210 [Bacteroidales bacterium]|nr:hypothetical protein [Bacteroidaceae bacterium]MBR4738407.1 hypothetical protein [Bacteroidales bacterium]